MKNLIVVVISWFLISFSAIAAERTKPINIRVTAQFGPIKSDQRYLDFASRTVNTILTNGIPQDQLWNKLLTNHVTGFPVTNTIWFAVEIWSEEPFLPSDMTAEIFSTPNNLFAKTNIFNNPNFVYDVGSIAEIIQANGSRTIVSSGYWNTQPVNHFVFLGSASKTIDSSSQQELANNSSWLLGFTNFTITAKWSISENGVITSSAIKTLQTRPSLSLSGRLEISNISQNIYHITLPQFTGLGRFQGTENVNGQWITQGEYSSGVTLAVNSSLPHYFFRLIIE